MSTNNSLKTTGTLKAVDGLQVSDLFLVDGAGNILRINDVSVSFPSVQGAAGTFLQNDGSGLLSWTPAGSWSTSIQTGAYQAANNDEIFADSSGGAFSITLPLFPSLGWRVRIADYSGTWASNNVTVDRNSENINGIADNFILDVNDGNAEFVYVDVMQGWRVLS